MATLHVAPIAINPCRTFNRRLKVVFKSLSFFLALVEYKAISKKTLQDSIESEMSGNLEKILVAVGEKNVLCCLPVSDPLH